MHHCFVNYGMEQRVQGNENVKLLSEHVRREKVRMPANLSRECTELSAMVMVILQLT